MPAWLIPALVAGASSLFGSLSAKKRQDEQDRLDRQAFEAEKQRYIDSVTSARKMGLAQAKYRGMDLPGALGFDSEDAFLNRPIAAPSFIPANRGGFLTGLLQTLGQSATPFLTQQAFGGSSGGGGGGFDLMAIMRALGYGTPGTSGYGTSGYRPGYQPFNPNIRPPAPSYPPLG